MPLSNCSGFSIWTSVCPPFRIPRIVFQLTLCSFNVAFAPLLLERKAEKIHKTMVQDAEKGQHRHIRTVFQSDDRHWKRIFAKSLIRPFALFSCEPILQLLGVYMAFIYGLLYREYRHNIHSFPIIIFYSVPHHDTYYIWSNIPAKAGYCRFALLCTWLGSEHCVATKCSSTRQDIRPFQKQEWRYWTT